MTEEMKKVDSYLGLDKESRYEQALIDIINFMPKPVPGAPDYDPYQQIAYFARGKAREVLRAMNPALKV